MWEAYFGNPFIIIAQWAVPGTHTREASAIGGLRKGVLSGRVGQKFPSHQPAGCPITFLLWLLFPASPPGPPASVLPPGDLACWRSSWKNAAPRGSQEAGLEAGLGRWLFWIPEGGLSRVLSLRASCNLVRRCGSVRLVIANQRESSFPTPHTPTLSKDHYVGSRDGELPLMTSPALTSPLRGGCLSSLPSGPLHLDVS